MKAVLKNDSLVPVFLLALNLVPLLAGMHRISVLAGMVAASSKDQRFLLHPVPIVIHVASVSLFGILGALQFSFRLRRNSWHRTAGITVVICGLISAASGLWLSQFFPRGPFDGSVLYTLRMFVGVTVIWLLTMGIFAFSQGNVVRHRACMTRAYALALGAGTQVITHMPWFMLPGLHSKSFRTACMASGWIINLVIAEWWLRTQTTNVTVNEKWSSREHEPIYIIHGTDL